MSSRQSVRPSSKDGFGRGGGRSGRGLGLGALSGRGGGGDGGSELKPLGIGFNEGLLARRALIAVGPDNDDDDSDSDWDEQGAVSFSLVLRFDGSGVSCLSPLLPSPFVCVLCFMCVFLCVSFSVVRCVSVSVRVSPLLPASLCWLTTHHITSHRIASRVWTFPPRCEHSRYCRVSACKENASFFFFVSPIFPCLPHCKL